MTMRIVFMGTPDFAVPTLEALAKAGHEIIAVYTQPPRPAGRGKAPRPSPVHQAALALGLEVLTPPSLRDPQAQAVFIGHKADVAVVAAYGLILPHVILDAPAQGCLNVHASLLPRWRGAAPVQRCILAGDAATGVTIMRMEAGLDTGPMFRAEAVPMAGKTAGELTDELAALGARLMVGTLDAPLPPGTPQRDEDATYAPKILKEEAHLDFSSGAAAVERHVRAFNPWPGAWCLLNGERLKLLAVEVDPRHGPAGMVLDDNFLIGCDQGSVRPILVQRAGKGAISAADMLRGRPVPVGSRLG